MSRKRRSSSGCRGRQRSGGHPGMPSTGWLGCRTVPRVRVVRRIRRPRRSHGGLWRCGGGNGKAGAGRGTRRRAPSAYRPDEHARSRRQDSRPTPHRGLRQALRVCWASRFLRRHRTDNTKIGIIDSRRTLVPARQPCLKTSIVLIRLRSTPRPCVTRLLRPKDRAGKTPQPSPHRTRETPLRRALRHAPRRDPLPIRSCPRSLTK